MTQIPRKLSTNPQSPHYDMDMAKKVDKVYVDGDWIPNCVAYDMDAGWAFGKTNGIWQPKSYGKVSVTLK